MRIHSASLRYFDAVRRAGTIREAARRLNVASSAVNRQILKLEEEIGAPLFDRLQEGLRLTASGEILARHVLNVLQDAERTRSELAALRGLRIGHVDLAATEGVAIDMLPAVLAKMREKHPRITITIRSMDSPHVPRAVIEGTADVGFAFSVTAEPELQQLARAAFPIGAVVASHHPLADKSSVTVDECMRYPLVLPTSDSSLNPAIHFLRQKAASLDCSIIEANSIRVMKHLAETGNGITFQTRIGIEADIRAGLLRHVPLHSSQKIPPSELGIYVRAGRTLPLAASALVQFFVEELQNWEERDAPADAGRL